MRIKKHTLRRGRRRRDGGNKNMGWRERWGINRGGREGQKRWKRSCRDKKKMERGGAD